MSLHHAAHLPNAFLTSLLNRVSSHLAHSSLIDLEVRAVVLLIVCVGKERYGVNWLWMQVLLGIVVPESVPDSICTFPWK